MQGVNPPREQIHLVLLAGTSHWAGFPSFLALVKFALKDFMLEGTLPIQRPLPVTVASVILCPSESFQLHWGGLLPFIWLAFSETPMAS